MRKTEAKWHDNRAHWRIDVQKDGVRKSFYSSTKGKRGKIETERLADIWLNEEFLYDKKRLADAWTEYLEQVKLLGGTSTYEQSESIGRLYILPSLKHKYVTSITLQDWQNCINEAYRKGLAKKSLKNIRGRITNFAKFARKSGYMKPIILDLDIPKNAHVVERKILQPDAVKLLFTDSTELFYNKPREAFFIHAIRFCVISGCRRGELCGLMTKDIKDNRVYINRSINRFNEETPGKNKNANRKNGIGVLLQKVLIDQQNMLKRKGIISPFVFPDEHGNRLPPYHFYQSWRRYRDTHGLDCDIQGLRRTMLSMVKNDLPEELAKLVVGHGKDIDTYGVYGREVDGEIEKAASIIDSVFESILQLD